MATSIIGKTSPLLSTEKAVTQSIHASFVQASREIRETCSQHLLPALDYLWTAPLASPPSRSPKSKSNRIQETHFEPAMRYTQMTNANTARLVRRTMRGRNMITIIGAWGSAVKNSGTLYQWRWSNPALCKSTVFIAISKATREAKGFIFCGGGKSIFFKKTMP